MINPVDFVFLGIGLIALVKGADFFVEGASKIARKYGISEFVIGVTLVAFATSLPEFAVSMTASFFNVPGIAIGNVVGSNIANVGLVIGIAALLHPISANREDYRQSLIMLGMLVFATFLMFGNLVRIEGIVLFALLIVYVYYLNKKEKRVKPEKDNVHIHKRALFLILGLLGVMFGSRLVVDSAVSIASAFGVSTVVIGMTVVAIGTSLPELVTSVVAAFKRMEDIALGNIIGSNLFNISFVLGLTAVVRDIPITARLMNVELPIMLGFGILLAIFLRTHWKITRLDGAILLIAYAGFLVMQMMKGV